MLTFPNVITAMVTPFNADGSVNYEGTVELAKHYAAQGSGILVAATTGEGATMTEDEKLLCPFRRYRPVDEAAYLHLQCTGTYRR